VPRVLHLVKDPGNQDAFAVVAAHARDPAIQLTVVLMQDAAALTGPLPGDVFRLDEGHAPRAPGSPYPPIDHSRLLDLIFAADTVVAW
jgi:hypothetical protein